MGASSSLLTGELNSEDISKLSEQERGNLYDVGFLFDAYDIKTKEDLEALLQKSTKTQATAAHSFELMKHDINAVQAKKILEGNESGEAFNDVVEEARSRVKTFMRQKSQESFTNFMVGLDGSKPSNNAYEVCLQELVKSRDGVIGLHCFDSTKVDDNLDPNLKPDALRNRFHVDLTMRTTDDGRFRLLWVDKEGKRTDSFLLQTVNEICFKRDLLDFQDRPSYFITGITGRKEASKQNKVGTLPMLAAGLFLIPNIIVKKEPILNRPRVFVCAIKSVEHIEPYNLCLDLAKPGNGDKIFILHIYDEIEEDNSKDSVAPEVAVSSTSKMSKILEIDQYFTERINDDGFSKSGSKFIAIPNKDKIPPHHIVLRQIQKLEADYVVIYPHIMVPGSEETNNCNEIIEEADCNIVVCRR